MGFTVVRMQHHYLINPELDEFRLVGRPDLAPASTDRPTDQSPTLEELDAEQIRHGVPVFEAREAPERDGRERRAGAAQILRRPHDRGPSGRVPGARYGAERPDDERANRITARHVLTHTSGLPNIPGPETPLRTHFEPGARFSYGSSAFAWLQRAMETVTGRPLEDLAKQRVFEPLAMPRSSLQWQDRFEANHARGQELDGQPVSKRRPQAAAASWSGGPSPTSSARAATSRSAALSASSPCWR